MAAMCAAGFVGELSMRLPGNSARMSSRLVTPRTIFVKSLLRNAMFTGRLSALPPVTYSRKKDFRLIRPLVFVSEDITRQYAGSLGAPVIPCGCSQKTGTVRRSLRDIFADLEREYPFMKENLLSAMGNIQPERLLDVRYLDADNAPPELSELFPVLTES